MIKVLALLALTLNSYSQAINPSQVGFYDSFNESINFLSLNTNDSKNNVIKGTNESFKPIHLKSFLKLYSSRNSNLQWELRNLTDNKILDQTNKAKKLFYGASITKIFVAATFLKNQQRVTAAQFQLLNDLIIKSSNSAWRKLQILIGSGDENKGRQAVQSYLNSLGIFKSIGFRGYLGTQHGNEVNIEDLATFVQQLYDNPQSQEFDLMKLMFLSRTGAQRLKRFISKDIIVAGKTGTYNGKTSVNGKSKTVASKHHLIVFNLGQKTYSLIVLSNKRTNEELAVLAKGLVLLKVKKEITL